MGCVGHTKFRSSLTTHADQHCTCQTICDNVQAAVPVRIEAACSARCAGPKLAASTVAWPS